MKNNITKQKVVDAASSLFFQKGFHGTSVRDIAERASVNVSLISYYFKGKQGLLEYAVTNYYEAYLEKIEESLEKTEADAAIYRLNELIFTIIHYKQMHHQLTCFIQRELSLDSVFVREMTVTYLAKENYYLKALFQETIGKSVGQEEKHYLFMQLKGMLITPYILHSDWKDQIVGEFAHEQFVKKYTKSIQKWIQFNTDVRIGGEIQ
ncbi:TetR family transcriptional regulator [Oceanobacillus oncorhynchi subsp. incaldanensis]|uniref:Putative HTH-type transcriptional regulator YttP n=1 Tax=Oceanobacillus oncorhynchi TaxID=545501 RepID=A0A0A1N0M8_9BACI|nr:forespore capture DNA-binding protein RefZ [Oceanobacillus oncorhynchi]MDM8100992.1 forespore capture DNA-binding protein RefZ [Oceanobacillus oncorhynchi]UUI38809.1 forespore capture DNA-binding protein RefZ [Oceanobacillus oncorhynchi]GIO20799.1 TetR family transcriptional regulator [Oceanobacillus oncorhynchi subsp. incaldanensis]CEI84516.1 putative HTH-type transcriptional regulator YttP [Oceanobacillus oncorhynchi]